MFGAPAGQHPPGTDYDSDDDYVTVDRPDDDLLDAYIGEVIDTCNVIVCYILDKL